MTLLLSAAAARPHPSAASVTSAAAATSPSPEYTPGRATRSTSSVASPEYELPWGLGSAARLAVGQAYCTYCSTASASASVGDTSSMAMGLLGRVMPGLSVCGGGGRGKGAAGGRWISVG